MIDASGHHLVYGNLRGYLSGAILKDTDDERIRQGLSRLLVEELGYDRHELEPRLRIITEFGGKRVQSLIELCARITGRRLFILRYGPGSLVSREKAAIAAARLPEPAYRIPPWPLSPMAVTRPCWTRRAAGYWPRAWAAFPAVPRRRGCAGSSPLSPMTTR